jgi:hypothetical protein
MRASCGGGHGGPCGTEWSIGSRLPLGEHGCALSQALAVRHGRRGYARGYSRLSGSSLLPTAAWRLAHRLVRGALVAGGMGWPNRNMSAGSYAAFTWRSRV